MSVKVRFFARFRELLGTDIMVEPASGSMLASVIRDITTKNKEGHDAIFDERGAFREFVIIMQNGKRIDTGDTGKTLVSDGDEIAVFPPVAGG
jgi:molybdopterin synthase sulfur carrier subunit